ncbi:double-stranded RNA-specific editase 1 [Bacillus rossius redtenbacheri]|uniref:double-stranded RNA-specific editase 1 n=1 Tax=Bacillus rossius redtenbacheri TaxID=93214 RepID=UPI002FDC92E5
MSYNTRRQGGVGRGTSQVMYHQQQQQQTSQRGSASPRPSGPPPNSQGYPSSYGTQPGGFSSGGNQQGYNTQQYQAQQQVVPPPPPPPIAVQQPPAPKPLQGILKSEAASPPQPQPQQPVKTPVSPSPGAVEVENDTEKMSQEDKDEERPRPPWMRKRPYPFKVSKAVMRRRQNARLRKMLQPKSALVVLTEVVPGAKFNFLEHINALGQVTYQANVEIEGKVYSGQSLNKTVAKQIASENALKAVLLDMISKSPVKMEQSGSEKGDENNDGSDGEENKEKSTDIPEDEVPWRSLTSFAIYKLFLEWQSDGTVVPSEGMPKTMKSPRQVDDFTRPSPLKKIPDNPTQRHPVMLINQMRPGIEFLEVSRQGNPPNITFTMQTTVDGKEYTGVGKNKKEARKEAAKAALAGAMNIHYP